MRLKYPKWTLYISCCADKSFFQRLLCVVLLLSLLLGVQRTGMGRASSLEIFQNLRKLEFNLVIEL